MATGSNFFIPTSQVRQITPSYSTFTTLGESTNKYSFRIPDGVGEREEESYVELSDPARLYGPLNTPPIRDTYIFRGVQDTNLYKVVGKTAKAMQTQIYRITNNENGAPLAEINRIHNKAAKLEPNNQLHRFLKAGNAREVAKWLRHPDAKINRFDDPTKPLEARLADPDNSKVIDEYVGKKTSAGFKAQVFASDMSLSVNKAVKGPYPHTKASRKKAKIERAERFKLAKEALEDEGKRVAIRVNRQKARAEQKQWLEKSMEVAVADSRFFWTEQEKKEKAAITIQKAFRNFLQRAKV